MPGSSFCYEVGKGQKKGVGTPRKSGERLRFQLCKTAIGWFCNESFISVDTGTVETGPMAQRLRFAFSTFRLTLGRIQLGGGLGGPDSLTPRKINTPPKNPIVEPQGMFCIFVCKFGEVKVGVRDRDPFDQVQARHVMLTPQADLRTTPRVSGTRQLVRTGGDVFVPSIGQ